MSSHNSSSSLKRSFNGWTAINRPNQNPPSNQVSLETEGGYRYRNDLLSVGQRNPKDETGATHFELSQFSQPHFRPLSMFTRGPLAPQNIYTQQEARLSRSGESHDDRVDHSQHLYQQMEGQDTMQDTSPLTQLANNMLFNRMVPKPRTHPSRYPSIHINSSHKNESENSFRPYQTQMLNTSPLVSDTSIYNQDLMESSSPALVSSPASRAMLRRTEKRQTTPLEPPISLDWPRQITKSDSQTPRFKSSINFSSGRLQAETIKHSPPVVNGIQLVSLYALPDRLRQVFPYELFNAVQSKCFEPVYNSNDNVIVSAPTGSGKTTILELAICQLVGHSNLENFKIVYLAPTKSLCSERVRDWGQKFTQLNLRCVELTGDTSQKGMKEVREASIIVTTPEKWDSITRKWKDHARLLQLVRLFLIDEVHILKDTRGATLEAVVSRMKTIGADMRFVALSATIPNSEDIALWLGKNSTLSHLPAHREVFGEEFRPVKLQKHVYGFKYTGPDHGFDSILDPHLPELIQKHTHKKPIMVFCSTRKICETTAASLATWWAKGAIENRAWCAPNQTISVQNGDLRKLVGCGVAFHHAGLETRDRTMVQSGFLEGNINLICCTSTLAVGVNLPCHLVVLKGTVNYQFGRGFSEISDLDMMQMLGRAGRPQFDDSAEAIIMTRSNTVKRYEMVASGQDILESTLHLSLIEHLNSEISLGTICDHEAAKKWLKSTFLAIRMSKNPSYYDIKGFPAILDIDEKLDSVCERHIRLLQENRLVDSLHHLRCTAYGEAMSRYMIPFETIKLLLGISEHAKIEEILFTICQADEFKEMRIKPADRKILKEFNKSPLIKYPIQDAVLSTAHKICLMIQIQLGGVDIPIQLKPQLKEKEFKMTTNIIFEQTQHLIRCVIDCKVAESDGVSARHALDLARSLYARCWENSNLALQQIPNIGQAAVKKLSSSKVNSIEQLAKLNTTDIERILSKNPPFGKGIRDCVLNFPMLTLKTNYSEVKTMKTGAWPCVQVNAQLGIANTKTPIWKNQLPSVTFTAENATGRLVSFWRGNIKMLENGFKLNFKVDVSRPDEEIKASVACDNIAGTVQLSSLRPNIPISAFPSDLVLGGMTGKENSKPSSQDYFDDNDINDEDFIAVVNGLENRDGNTSGQKIDSKFSKSMQISNTKFTCRHSCSGGYLGNGQPCKHRCCHNGIDRPTKAKSKSLAAEKDKDGANKKQLKIQSKAKTTPTYFTVEFNDSKSPTSDDDKIEWIDLTNELTPSNGYKNHQDLHRSTQTNEEVKVKNINPPTEKPLFLYPNGSSPDFSFLSHESRPDNMSKMDIEGSLESSNYFKMHDYQSPKNEDDYGDSIEEKNNPEYLFSNNLTLSIPDESSSPNICADFADDIFGFEMPESYDLTSPIPSSSTLKEPQGNVRIISSPPDMPPQKRRRVSSPTEHKTPLRTKSDSINDQEASVPSWVAEMGSDLIDELKGIVDFVD